MIFIFFIHDISIFDSITILFRSRMIALEPIATGYMCTHYFITINHKFICIVCTCMTCMCFWSGSLLFLTSKSWKDCPNFVSMKFLTWLTMAIFWNHNLPISQYRNRIKKGSAIFDIIVLSPSLFAMMADDNINVSDLTAQIYNIVIQHGISISFMH